MKIHMDYLEGKDEEYENAKVRWESERKSFKKRASDIEEKVKKELG